MPLIKRKPKDNDKVRVSVDGIRMALTESIEELKGHVEDVVDGEFVDNEDLVEALNDVIRHSNLINCIYIKGDDMFNDISHISVEEIV